MSCTDHHFVCGTQWMLIAKSLGFLMLETEKVVLGAER